MIFFHLPSWWLTLFLLVGVTWYIMRWLIPPSAGSNRVKGSLHNKKLFFLLIPLTEIRLFQSLNHQKGNLKVWLLIKRDYYIVPNSSTILHKGQILWKNWWKCWSEENLMVYLWNGNSQCAGNQIAKKEVAKIKKDLLVWSKNWRKHSNQKILFWQLDYQVKPKYTKILQINYTYSLLVVFCFQNFYDYFEKKLF